MVAIVQEFPKIPFRKVIYFKTTNKHKAKEYATLMSRYWIEARIVSPIVPIKGLLSGSQLLESEKWRLSVFAVITELSTLLNKDWQRWELMKGDTAINYAMATIDMSDWKVLTYEAVIEWVMTWDLNSISNEDVFWFDSIFRPLYSDKSYHSLLNDWIKTSARQLVISQFLEEHLSYLNQVKLNHSTVSMTRPVDFSPTVRNFIEENQFVGWNKAIIKSELYPIIEKALSKWLFFRSSKNRRMKNYWLPGLNAWIPLVPKADPVHEITFMMHDIFHFLIPDIIPIIDDDLNHKTYIFSRMMSEAVTMVMADMIYINELKASWVEYDYSKRKIYPLLEDILTHNKDTDINDIIYANVSYALLWDESKYLELWVSRSNMDAFKLKFAPFFIEDYKWSEANYKSIISRHDKVIAWYYYHKDNNTFPLDLDTTRDVIVRCQINKDHNHEEIVKKIFDDNISNINSMSLKDIDAENSMSLIRWLLWQSFATFIYGHLKISLIVREAISNLILRIQDNENIEALIHEARDTIDNYFNELYESNFITADDLTTFKEVFPFFSPSFANYDLDKSYYNTIEETKNAIF